MLNEFLPILAPVEKKQSAYLGSTALNNFYIQNFGKGPAKNVEVFIASVQVCKGHSISKGEEEVIVIDTEAHQELKNIVKEGRERLRMRICYEDIYGRNFKTVNIILDKTAKDRYILRRGKWDFKRINNKK